VLGPVISLRRLEEMHGWWREGDAVVLGACVTFAAWSSQRTLPRGTEVIRLD
jgi:hypothetical protein